MRASTGNYIAGILFLMNAAWSFFGRQHDAVTGIGWAALGVTFISIGASTRKNS